MAEYLLRQKGNGRFEVFSAGAKPAGTVHPLIRWVLERHFGINTDDARSKSWEEFKDVKFDFIITVCDDAKEACPIWPGLPVTGHWSSPDPAAFEGDEAEKRQYFVNVATQIARRIDLFCAFPDDKLLPPELSQVGEQFKIESPQQAAR